MQLTYYVGYFAENKMLSHQSILFVKKESVPNQLYFKLNNYLFTVFYTIIGAVYGYIIFQQYHLNNSITV